MRMEFEFINQYNPSFDSYEQLFTRLLRKALKHLNIAKDIILETLLVDNDTIKALNKQYRGIDKVTDVISFAFQDKIVGEVVISDLPFIDLGTIIISVPKAIEQAEQYGHGLERELSFLFIHGLLHLCGYDHQTSADEQKMLELQDTIIGKRVSK